MLGILRILNNQLLCYDVETEENSLYSGSSEIIRGSDNGGDFVINKKWKEYYGHHSQYSDRRPSKSTLVSFEKVYVDGKKVDLNEAPEGYSFF